MIELALVVVLAGVGLGVVALLVASVVSHNVRRNRRQLQRLEGAVREVEHELLTPEERAELARRLEEIEDQKRRMHGRYDDGT